MRLIPSLQITVFSLSSLVAACISDDLDPQHPEGDVDFAGAIDPAELGDRAGQAIAPATSALCLAQPTPPSPNFTHNFNTNPTLGPITIADTGTECDGYNTKWIGSGKVTFRVTSQTTDPEACVNTVLTLINWQWQGTAWGRYTSTYHGEYTASGCVLPAPERNVYNNYHFEIRASRKSCATTPYGEICGTTWGLPVKMTGAYCNPKNGGCIF
jgi:hypothetical protein